MESRRSIFDVPTDTQLGVTRLVSARGRVAAVGDAGRGPEVMLLKLSGDSQIGAGCSVVVSAIKSPDLDSQGYTPGVITAIVKFGNGAGVSELQFDIPCAETHDPLFPATNGTAFTVPAGNFELYARDDSMIIPQAGMGHPSNVGGSMVTAFVVRGRLGMESILHKTEFFAWAAGGLGLAPTGTSRRFAVPPFAATYILTRYPRNALTVRLGNNRPTPGNVLVETSINTSDNHSAQLVPPRCSWIEVQNDDSGDIQFGQIIFNMDHQFAANHPWAYVDATPALRSYSLEQTSTPPHGFTGPITLSFSDLIDPTTVVLQVKSGSAPLPSSWNPASTLRIWMQHDSNHFVFSFVVSGSTIAIHQTSASEAPDVWETQGGGNTVMRIFVTPGVKSTRGFNLTPVVESLTAGPAGTPRVSYSWVDNQD